jgi:hypothetical protein
LTGTAGGVGTYTVSISQTRTSGDFTGTFTVGSTTLSVLSTIFHVTAVASGTLSVGQFLTGTGIDFGTSITALGTGTGGVGTYTLSAPEYFASTTVSASAGNITAGTTGGSKDAIVVSHTHAATSVVTETPHSHGASQGNGTLNIGSFIAGGLSGGAGTNTTNEASTGITVATTNSTVGSSGTNANLPPYYALAYIMKT